MAIYISKRIKKKGGSIEDSIKIVIIACALEGLLCVISYIFPSIRLFFLNIMAENGSARSKMHYTDPNFLAYRAYGFADNLLDTFGYGMGLAAGLCLLWRKGILSMLAFILCTFGTLVNSRSGLIMIIIAFGLLILQYKPKTHRKIQKNWLLAIPLIIILITSFFFAFGVNDITMTWIEGGYKGIYNFITGTKGDRQLGSMENSMFTEKFWTHPTSITGLIFGEGHTVYTAPGYVHSDVGYVNYLWAIGILGLTLLLIFIFRVFLRSIQRGKLANVDIVYKYLCICFFLMFIKANIITHSAGTFITVFLIVFIWQYDPCSHNLGIHINSTKVV